MPPSPRRRSPFADRLSAFAAFAFGDDAVFARRGAWRAFFRERIGPAFDGRLILEIGCSDGDFLARLAAKWPTTGFIGLDWKHKSLFTAAGRIDAAGLRNVALLRGRGQDVAAMFADGELDEILVLHPDPFATPAELPNRLIAEPFLIDAKRVLRNSRSTDLASGSSGLFVKSSTLTLKTDHPGYYQWTLALLGQSEPAHFAAARSRATETPALAGAPRIRASDLMAPADLPPASQAVLNRFDIAATSADYWNDPAILFHTGPRVFAGERTLFEERFLRKRLPIYYVELRSK